MSGASERANGRASGPVPQSVFLAVLDHSDGVKLAEKCCVKENVVISVTVLPQWLA